MQLKLLNFHKILSQFASNLVGAFIALIIYQSTNSFTLAFLFLSLSMILRIVLTKLFYNLMKKYPQLFLAIRIVPFLLYSLSLLLLDTNYKVLGIVLSVIFYGFTVAFKDIPLEVLFSYSSLGKGSSSYGVSRLFDYAGYIIAIIIGGLFLDNLPKIYVILLACGVYFISVVPLVIYYFKQKNTKGFNEEAISNAVESFQDIKVKKRQQKVVTRKLLIRYYIIYLLFCSYDALMSLFSLYLFKVNSESYSLVSYVQASFYALFGLGCYFGGKLDDKIDMTALVMFSCVFSGALVCVVPFVTNIIWVEVVLFGVIGFLYSFISVFCYSRMMMRCKIMGKSNRALLNRAQASRYSQAIVYTFAAISPIMFIPAFVLSAVMFASCAVVIPLSEESTRKALVDYLQNNKMY